MPTVIVAHFKTNIYEYLEALQKSTLDKLYEEPATCLAIFRLLPSLARQLVMSLLFSTQIMSKADLKQWIKNDKESLSYEALDKLQKLHIMIEQENKTIALNSSFKQKFQECLTGGGTHQSFGKLYNKPHRHSQSNSHKLPDIKLLDEHAKTKWEEILHFMVGTDRMNSPGASVLKVVTKANLMREKEGKGLEITNKGFQFLLQDVNTQVWAFLIQYLDLASEMLHMNVVEVLNFFFMLGSLELGQDYSVEGLTDTQRQLLDDLTNYGLIYRPKKSSKRYYPTRLATTLTSGNSAIVSNVASNNPTDDDDSATEQGFIIVETNYKLYAYTSSQLQISVLNLFCNLQFQFSNMVTAELTRESVRKALKHGITASQIISYLTSHAHPQMKKRPALLPSTVVDQIQLWEMELNRLVITNSYLYKEFRTFADYEVVLKHANTLGVVVWSSDSKKMIGITEAGHERVKAFIKRKIVQRRSNGGDTTSSAGGTPAR
ncbi:transcription factor TFIIH complex subunit Tfb2 [Gigaspora rosea]|uniref:RNA polymerase II transcription factor B subunit 2 n=1 Tax=Gigaspora rosea TaxID=44941 RepID=A0A397UTH5_9GLOM|nr:transcription factor TFIIH complex subunit Tfb2 [Gigaspora rosea]